MGIFGGKNRIQSQPKATTLIAEGCTVNGHIQVANALQIDGHVEGQIEASKLLRISRSGYVVGEITTERLIINGTFEGTCHAKFVEILSSGHITGTIYSDNLTIEPGGKFNGNSSDNKVEKAEKESELIDDKVAIMDNLKLG
ncbi:polymer-forming cytoskeletal protein [Marinomonas sp. C2222]|uniref:Polymer-forming cytoskeletal protein n=1 Tax=Marinomonas sargassi TaxID=2984494 RepID=A0ABT2YTI0_9GAMM|nr:polymer-forming cytoskeletal protein [Marinomonas sargassi]MCV2403209.1 polymer-forming cytoskeletal protein [Marinomonas sargassi]